MIFIWGYFRRKCLSNVRLKPHLPGTNGFTFHHIDLSLPSVLCPKQFVVYYIASRYIAVEYSTVLNTMRKEESKSFVQTPNSQKTSHTSPLQWHFQGINLSFGGLMHGHRCVSFRCHLKDFLISRRYWLHTTTVRLMRCIEQWLGAKSIFSSLFWTVLCPQKRNGKVISFVWFVLSAEIQWHDDTMHWYAFSNTNPLWGESTSRFHSQKGW